MAEKQKKLSDPVYLIEIRLPTRYPLKM